jgi:hypothetical protein
MIHPVLDGHVLQVGVRRVQSEISDFGFETQESFDFKIPSPHLSLIL